MGCFWRGSGSGAGGDGEEPHHDHDRAGGGRYQKSREMRKSASRWRGIIILRLGLEWKRRWDNFSRADRSLLIAQDLVYLLENNKNTLANRVCSPLISPSIYSLYFYSL